MLPLLAQEESAVDTETEWDGNLVELHRLSRPRREVAQPLLYLLGRKKLKKSKKTNIWLVAGQDRRTPSWPWQCSLSPSREFGASPFFQWSTQSPLFLCQFNVSPLLIVWAKKGRKKERKRSPLLVGLEKTLGRAWAQGQQRIVGSVASQSTSSSSLSSSSSLWSIHITLITMMMVLQYHHHVE